MNNLLTPQPVKVKNENTLTVASPTAISFEHSSTGFKAGDVLVAAQPGGLEGISICRVVSESVASVPEALEVRWYIPSTSCSAKIIGEALTPTSKVDQSTATWQNDGPPKTNSKKRDRRAVEETSPLGGASNRGLVSGSAYSLKPESGGSADVISEADMLHRDSVLLTLRRAVSMTDEIIVQPAEYEAVSRAVMQVGTYGAVRCY